MADTRVPAQGERDVLPEGAHRLGELRFGFRSECRRDRNPGVAFAAALERKVDPHGDLRWPPVVRLVEPGTQQVEMVSADARHRVRA
jgi:hypothetical protein